MVQDYSVDWTARRLPLKEVEGARETDDGFVTPSGYQVRKVSIWGVVVRKFVGEKSTMLLLDDFTATLPVVLFQETDVDEGDVVRVIGRISKRNDEIRILADVVRKISTEEELYHRLQNALTLLEGKARREGDEEEVVEEVEVVDLL